MTDTISETVVGKVEHYSNLIDKGLAALREASTKLATAERDYRDAVADAWKAAPKGTVPEREAWVKQVTAEDREKRDSAEYARQDALEAVRARRTQLSAVQSLLAAHREEVALARTAP